VYESWDALPEGAVTDVDAAMMHAALEVVGLSLFGTDLSQDAERLASATLEALDVVVARARVPITPPAWVLTPANRRLQRAVAQLDGAVASMLQQPVRGHDMLALLRSVRDESGAGLTPAEIRDQVVTFIVAGHETVASAMTWAWALVAKHPHVQQRLQAEADAVLGTRSVTFADLERFPYARAVFDETLRLYPPAWLITRKALDADVLGGHDIPSGALIIVSPWLLHRHPQVWQDPQEFRPERFLEGDVDRTAFIPFGAGPRLCIGRDFSYVEGVAMLAIFHDPALVRRTADTVTELTPPLAITDILENCSS
jgi:cytochrome P450